jgi:hypothetical protein
MKQVFKVGKNWVMDHKLIVAGVIVVIILAVAFFR